MILFYLTSLIFGTLATAAQVTRVPEPKERKSLCLRQLSQTCKDAGNRKKSCIIKSLKTNKVLCASIIKRLAHASAQRKTHILAIEGERRKWQPLFVTLAFVVLGIAWSLTSHERKYWDGHLNEQAPLIHHFLALAIDLLAITTVHYTLAFIFNRPFLTEWISILTLYWIYSAFAHSGSGKTFGKSIMGITVRRPKNEIMSLLPSIGRSSISTISLILFALGHWLALVDKNRRTLADMIVQTQVYKQEPRSRTFLILTFSAIGGYCMITAVAFDVIDFNAIINQVL